MIDSTEHIIGSQQFHITSFDERNAYQYQSAISVLQESAIQDLIEKIFNRFSDPKSIYRFKQVELDLGTVSSHNLDNELLFKLEEQLIQFFKSNIQSDGNLRKGEKIIRYNEKLEQFEHYLINGFLKWNSSSSYTPQKLLHELFKEAPDSLTELLFQYGKKQEIRKRMILQFPEESLESIVTHVAPTEGEYMVTYKRNMLDHHQKTKFIDSSYSTFRNAIWEIILAYLFNAPNSYYNRKSFLQFLIQKIALKYNLTYQVLLEIISKGVTLNPETSQIPEFKKLVIELQEDESIISAKKVQKSRTNLSHIIEQIELFLNHQTYSARSLISSPEQFKSKLQLLFQNPDKLVKAHIAKWFQNPPIILQLIQLLDSNTITIFLEIGAPIQLHQIQRFWNELKSKKTTASSASIHLIQQIEQHKAQLILYALTLSKDNPALSFLIAIEKEIDFYSNQLVTLLTEMNQSESNSFQTTISEFLQHRSQPTNLDASLPNDSDEIILSILSELKNFTSQNDAFTWSEWLQTKLPVWLTKFESKIETPEFLNVLQEKLKTQFESPELISFITKELNSRETKLMMRSNSNNIFGPNKNYVHPLLIESITKELKVINLTPYFLWQKHTFRLFQKISSQYKISFEVLVQNYLSTLPHNNSPLQKALQKMITDPTYIQLVDTNQQREIKTQFKKVLSFVLHFEKWPWWIPQYDFDQFNQDFEIQWKNSTTQKVLLKIILRKSNTRNLDSIFNTSNIYKIWQAIDTTSQKQKALFLIRIHKLLLKRFIPVSSISKTQVAEFNKLSLEVLIHSSTSKRIIASLQQWLNSTSILTNGATRKIWITTLKTYASTAGHPTKKEILQWVENLNSKSLFLDSAQQTIQLFLTNYNSDSSLSSKSIQEQLEQITIQKSAVMNQWLQQIEFRTSIVNNLSEKNLIDLIQLQLSSQQQHFFKAAIGVYQHLMKELSAQESKQFQSTFYDLVLLKISTANTSNWTLFEWGHIIVDTLIKLKISIDVKDYSDALDKVKQQYPLLIQNILISLESTPSRNTQFPKTSDQTAKGYIERLKKYRTQNQYIEWQTDFKIVLSEHKEWLGQTDFTKELIENMSEKDLTHHIKDVLYHTHQEHFETALNFIESIQISTTERKKIKSEFFQLILIKIGTGGFTPWGLQNWSTLIFYLLKNTLNQTKFSTTILTEKEKLMTSSPSEKELEFLLHVQKESHSNHLPNTSPTSKKPEDDNYSRLGEEQGYQYLDPIYINFSGLIILSPYLGMLFERCGLTQNNAFIDHESQSRAVHLLDYAATGSVGKEEHELIIHKVLCGLQIADPITSVTELTDTEKETVNGLLHAITQQWTALNNTSIEGLRASFLIRMGKLEEDEDAFHLKIDQKAYDMLLDQIPWNITQIKLSWMEKILQVEWR